VPAAQRRARTGPCAPSAGPPAAEPAGSAAQAVDRDPVLSSTTSAKMGKTAIYRQNAVQQVVSDKSCVSATWRLVNMENSID